jgi:hypothetical protein
MSTMITTMDYLTAIQLERERELHQASLARLVARIRDCCKPGMLARLARLPRQTTLAR